MCWEPRLYAASAVIALLNSCAIIGSGDVNNLSLASAQRADLKDHPEIIWLSNTPKPSEPIIEIFVETKTNLAKLAKSYEYNVFPVASICKDNQLDNANKLQFPNGVYDQMGRIDAYRTESTSDGNSNMVYRIFVYAKSTAVTGPINHIQYDLIKNPRDICIEIHGGNVLGRSFLSNTIVIPRDTISDLWSR